ncbi:helix-turn-helix domain-containing protein [Roseibium sp. MMSF_3412]|uniref:winged helix-turn-helix transcriptional regulator n=1 Tax=Roseibium sp. MMSF_3412 TaxID=3046712 RepID=UPI00273DDE0B|nr:helix-turn-helix domain-containing protein [Roseibium sp. MMSF_3412]
MKIIPLAPDPDAQCPVTLCLSVIGGKWKPVIIFCIVNGVDRFGALQRAIPNVTKQMLTKQLRELEADGLVTRTVYPQVPPRVDYALTDKGRSVLPVIEAMKAWGEANIYTSEETGRS